MLRWFIVLLFERLRVEEPDTFLEGTRIYADVLVEIDDEVLIDIATKVISIDDAINQKLFRVRGSRDLWRLQLEALRELLPYQHFKTRALQLEERADAEVIARQLAEELEAEEKRKEREEQALAKVRALRCRRARADAEYKFYEWSRQFMPEGRPSNLNNVPVEFKAITDHFKSILKKYSK